MKISLFTPLYDFCLFLQTSTANSLQLIEDPHAETVDYIASKMGLRKVNFYHQHF